MRKFIYQIAAGILGFWLAVKFVPQVELKVIPDSGFLGIPLTARWQLFLLLGIILGLLNFFLRPLLKTITLPLRILTLGLFGLVISMVIIWIVDLLFQELTVPWFLPLFWTTIIIWGVNIIIPGLWPKRKKE